MIYIHGWRRFKDEEAAREYVKKEIRHTKEYWEKAGEKCTEIVEKIEREGNEHIFSFTIPMAFNSNKTFVISYSYVAQENRRRKRSNNEKHRKAH